MFRKWIVLVVGALLGLALSVGVSAESVTTEKSEVVEMPKADLEYIDSQGGYGGGGPFIGVLNLSLDSLNQKLVANGFAPLDNQIWVIGGGGAGGTLYWNIGGWGMGAESTSKKGVYEARFSMGMGGFNIQRSLPIGPVALTTGLMIGGGSAELKLVELATPTIDEAFSKRYETSFENTFFALVPAVGMRVKLTDFIFIEADAMYLATLGKWKFQERSIEGLPSLNGGMIKVGLVFGGSTN